MWMLRVVNLLFIGLFLAWAFASHFTGSYQDPQTGVSMVIQHGTDGRMQGTFSGPNGQFAFQGQGNEQGAYGAMRTPQGVLGFQAQLSPDGQTLQLSLFKMDQNDQPVATGQQQLTLRRVSGTANPTLPNPTVPGGQTTPRVPTPPPGAVQMPPGSNAGWNGTFVGNAGQLIMMVQGQQGRYTGYLQMSGQRYPFQAQGDETYLEGMFQANGTTYNFAVERYQGTVYLSTGNTEYILSPAGAAPNQNAPSGNPLGN